MQNQISFDLETKRAVIDGIEFDLVQTSHNKTAETELTLEKILAKSKWFFTIGGVLSEVDAGFQGSTLVATKQIAKKQILFGMLHSVAYYLNGGAIADLYNACEIGYNGTYFEIIQVQGYNFGNPMFLTEELAQQAIDLFEKSPFNLIDLYV